MSGPLRARWRIAGRLARRQVRRTISSSVLIAVLIALPIAAMAAFAVTVWSMTATPEEQTRTELGNTQAWVQPVGIPDAGFWQAPTDPTWYGYPFEEDQMTVPDGDPVTDPTAALASGVETILVTEGQVRTNTADGVATLPAWTGDVWDARFTGRFDLIDGRAPEDRKEALVTPAALDRLGISIGGEVTLTDSDESFEVVGTMTAAGVGTGQAAFFLPDSAPVSGIAMWFLPDTALSWAEVQELNEQGVVAYSREVVLDPPEPSSSDVWRTYIASRDGALWNLLTMLAAAGIFAAYVVVMLAGAAFSVAARRQQRSLAVAASVGATSADLRRTIVLQGTALGLIGGLIGIFGGVGLAVLIMAITDDGSGTRYWGLHIPWLVLAAILVFSVLVGTASAGVPARTVARSDTLSALRGARRPQTPRASRPVWGSIILLAGVGITIASAAVTASLHAVPQSDLAWDSPLRVMPPFGIVIGPILVQLGILLSGRWLLWLTSRALSRASIAARLASRDAAANASRTVPAFAAIGATVFIAVFTLSQVSMTNANGARNWFYQAPVGALAVSFYPNGQGQIEPLNDEQINAATESALDLAVDAGASDAAVIRVQVDPGFHESSDRVPDELIWVTSLMPERYLIDPMTQNSYTSNGQSPTNPISVVDSDDLSTVLGVELSAADFDAYRDGAAVTTDSRWVTDGTVDFVAWSAHDASQGSRPNNIFLPHPDEPAIADPLWEERMDAVVIEQSHHPTAIAISPETAQRLGMTVQPERVIADFADPLIDEDLDRIQSRADLLSPQDVTLAPYYERGPNEDQFWMIPILGVVAVLVLGASAVALGLARFERRPDDATLTAIGGTPALRRRIGFWQGLIIAGFGTLAGAAAGILPPIGFAIQSRDTLLISDIPWLALGLLAVALPLLIAISSWLVPPRAPDLTRRTVIA